MEGSLSEWLNLLFRWFHVIAGITWIGQTYLFNWFERTFKEEGGGEGNIAGRLWMVHGGGFYLVEKQKVPQLMPRTLHWFKWESFLTWVSGLLLLTVVYYAGGLMVELDGPVSNGAAIGIGVAVLVLGWTVYDLLWKTPFNRNEALGAAVCWGLVTALAWGLFQVLSARAAYMHIGAMFGTIMVANVWMRILPGQRRMIEAVKAGKKPDMTQGALGAQRSRHNTFMSVPLVFIMVSNHFPMATYGAEHGWAVLSALVLLGFGGAKLMRDYL